MFYFYFYLNELKVFRPIYGFRFSMASNKNWFLYFGGIGIQNNRNFDDTASCFMNYFNKIDDFGSAKINGNNLNFAGG